MNSEDERDRVRTREPKGNDSDEALNEIDHPLLIMCRYRSLQIKMASLPPSYRFQLQMPPDLQGQV
jgi:hypothetical protein